MLLLMWLAEFPPARITSSGAPGMSTNPLIDYHVVYAIALIVAALTYAGHTWGLGRWLGALPFVRRHTWTI
jgi:thiosulfate dehydrogenase [quinone] large subunit